MEARAMLSRLLSVWSPIEALRGVAFVAVCLASLVAEVATIRWLVGMWGTP